LAAWWRQLQIEHDLRPAARQEPGSGKRIDYHGLSRVLEENIREKYELAKRLDKAVAGKETPKIKIHVIGFAKLIGELIDGLLKVMMFFGIAALIATAIIYAYTRCVRSTVLVVACSTLPWSGSSGLSRSSVSSSTRSRSWCRSWCSRSACRTARRR
jgi:hypothetical protein